MSVSSLNLLFFYLLTDRGWPHLQEPTLPLLSVTLLSPVATHQSHTCFSPGDLQVLLHLFGLLLEHPQPVHMWGILSRSLLEVLSLCPPTGLTFGGSCCVVQHLSTVTNTPRWSMERGRNIYFHAWFLRLPFRVTWLISLVLWWQSVLGLDM